MACPPGRILVTGHGITLLSCLVIVSTTSLSIPSKKTKVLTPRRPFAGNLDFYLRLKPRSEQCFVREPEQRVKGESEKKDKERTTQMDEDLAGLDPTTVEKSYPGLYSFIGCNQGLGY